MKPTKWCSDCKVEMEFIVPNNSENYYKCPKCGVELAEDCDDEE
jgi:predicted RNA-binding Zn-ribbon protein involved in translation (DUF1610 family)